MTGEPDGAGSQVPTESKVDVDAALVVAAVARMQAADHEARQTLARLRNGLSAMAEAVDRAKAQNAAAAAAGHDDLSKVVDIAAMLDEFEHLVDGLVEVAAGRTDQAAPAVPLDIAQQAMESAREAAAPDVEAVAPSPADLDQVPTVSGVVSRLDPEQPLELAETEAREPAFTHASAPSVEMLKSLVEALNASIPDETPEAEALAETPGYQATAKIMAQDVIQAFAWELTRGDEKESPEAAAEAIVAETHEAPHVAAVELPEQIAELAEIAPVEHTAPEAVAAATAEAGQEIEPLATEAQVAEAQVAEGQATEAQVTESAAEEVPQAFQAPHETAITQDLEHLPAETPEPASAQPAEPEVAQAAEPESAEAEPLVFDVVVEFDPVEPEPVSVAETIEAPAEPVEADPPIPVVESTENFVHAAAESGNDVYVLSADDLMAVETQGSGAEEATAETVASDNLAEGATAAPAPEALIETVEPAFDSVEAPADIAQAETGQPVVEFEVAPEAAEPIHAEATPEAVADTVAVEPPPEAHAEAAPVEEVAPVEMMSADAAIAEAVAIGSSPIEYILAGLPTMPHEASLDETVAGQPAPETEHPVAAAMVETISEPAPIAEAAPAMPIVVAAPLASAAPVAADVVVYEVELMARIEQMEALPLLPPELGTAVIFGRHEPQLPPAIDLNIAPEAEPAPTAEAVTEPAVVREPVSELTAEPVVEIAVESAPEVVAEAVPEIAPAAEMAASPEAVAEPLPEALAAPEALPTATEEPASESVTAEAAPQPATSEAKLIALEAEADSDDFLFEPAGNTSTNGAEAAPSGRAAATPPAAERIVAAAPPQRIPLADPLIPIKAMTVEERIALFS